LNYRTAFLLTLKKNKMQIFNIEIFGETADKFMAMSCADKKKFIKENSNQQSDELIEQFLKSVNRGNDDECHGCKKAKNEQPKTNTPEVTAAIEPANVAGNSSGASDKRRNKPTRD